MLYRHNRTGNLYRVLAVGVDCTNSRDGLPVVVYCPQDETQKVYVRELDEFDRKFRRQTNQGRKPRRAEREAVPPEALGKRGKRGLTPFQT